MIRDPEKYTQRSGEPLHSGTIARIANDPDHEENAENEAALVRDGIIAFEWLSQDASRTMLGTNWVRFARDQGWTRAHRHTVADLVRTELQHSCQESAEQARARLVEHADGVYREARLGGEYAAAVSALKLQADMLLPSKDKTPAVSVTMNQFVVRLPEKSASVEAWEAEAAQALPPPK